MSTKRSVAVAAMMAMVLCLAAGGAGAGMVSPTDQVPTPGGVYQGDNTVFFSPVGIVVTNVKLVPSTGVPTYVPPTTGGTITANSFFDIFTEVSVDGGGTFTPMSASSVPSTIRITGGASGGGVRSFDTEMLSLNISGGTLPAGVMIRESPTLASNGQHSITDLAVGTYQIDSFFDIFTELSVDGGASWMPAQGLQGPSAMHVVLTPEPATMTLLGLGGLVALIRRRRST
ncbi:MAG: PEP-CTERM sorting domain-containing protein [Planctomycetota bacterium]|nr:PEP-CTERM sorting domain-containing protein [Planctomycetota bacterium]